MKGLEGPEEPSREKKIPLEIQAALIQQEHRLFPALWNYFYRRRREFTDKSDPRRRASAWALLYRLASPASVVLTGGGLAAVVVGVAGVYVAVRANALIEEQNRRLEQQTHLMEAHRRTTVIPFLIDVLDRLDGEESTWRAEGKREPFTLSGSLVSRIAFLSQVLEPYRKLEGNGELSDTDVSPERGQLFIALHAAGVLRQAIGGGASFEGANLRGAMLRGADLGPAKLAGADLSGAELDRAVLNEADLSRANLYEANLIEARLAGTDLGFANLTGAVLGGANLRGAKLNSGELATAKLWRADLTGADLPGANLSAADLSDADLTEADLSNAWLSLAKLAGTKLTGANLYGADLSDANLLGIVGWRKIESVERANVAGVQDTPSGFLEWATQHGAVQMPIDRWAEFVREPQ